MTRRRALWPPAAIPPASAALVLAAGALFALAAAWTFALAPGAPGGGSARFDKGMIFGLFARERPAYASRSLAEIRSLGANAVGIMVPWVIADVSSTTMGPREDMTPSDRSLRRAIRMARDGGLRVFLMPFLFVDDVGEGKWRGTIDPPDWRVWFSNYTTFILHYASLAEQEGVDLFSVGSELCSTESRRGDWLDLIRAVREVYSGRITYSANWDHRDGLSFAGELDVLGMNAYFKLSEGGEPAVSDLVRAWRPIVEEIEAWRRSHGKELIITEVGYPSRRGASVDPWNHGAEGAPAPREQYRCYRAFRQVWGGKPHVVGVYFYQWWGDGGPRDTGYTPRGKPAETVIRQWY